MLAFAVLLREVSFFLSNTANVETQGLKAAAEVGQFAAAQHAMKAVADRTAPSE